jgi:hypothetical protein
LYVPPALVGGSILGWRVRNIITTGTIIRLVGKITTFDWREPRVGGRNGGGILNGRV